MTEKTKTAKSLPVVRGNISGRREELTQEYEIFLPTKAVNGDGKLIMQDYTDPYDGKVSQIPELATTAFCGVKYRKNYMTAKMEDTLREQRLSDEFTEELEVETGRT